MDTITLSALRPAQKAGSLVGWVDTTINGVKIKDIRVITSKLAAGTVFAGLPAKKGKNGKYYNLVRLTDEEYKALNTAINALHKTATPAQQELQNVPPKQEGLAITDDEAVKLLPEVASALHAGNNTILNTKVSVFKSGLCHGLDFGGYRFLTQNAQKQGKDGKFSTYALRAQKGEKITWIFKGSNVVALCVDGKVEDKRVKAAANPTTAPF